jgi:hypothetical protein
MDAARRMFFLTSVPTAPTSRCWIRTATWSAAPNDVKMIWDGNAYSSSTHYTGPGGPANITASSTTPFFVNTWTAHDIQVFVPGSYSFDISLGGGNPESGILSMNVGLGQFGLHMLFDWNGNYNIDLIAVANPLSVFGSGKGSTANPGCNSGPGATPNGVNCLYDGGAYGSAGMPNAANPMQPIRGCLPRVMPTATVSWVPRWPRVDHSSTSTAHSMPT